MKILELNAYQLISGGRSASHCPATEENSSFFTRKLHFGAAAGAIVGAITGYNKGASPLGYTCVIATFHFIGMMSQAGYKFVTSTIENMQAHDRCRNPFVDTFCK